MPGALVVKSVAVSSSWTKLSATPLVLDADLVAPAANASPVKVRFDGAPSAGEDWPAGVALRIGVQDLSRIEVSGADGDAIQYIGRAGQ